MSGLVQTAESEQEKATPWISKVPVIGNLFKSKEKTKESMQMVIYLVPHITGEVLPSEEIDLAWAEEVLSRALEDTEKLEVMNGKEI